MTSIYMQIFTRKETDTYTRVASKIQNKNTQPE